MSEKRNRRVWTPEKKLKLVIESLQSDGKAAEICRREGLAPNQLYDWRKKLLGSAEAVFARKDSNDREDARIEKLQQESARMKGVIAEITAENLDLKKTLSD
jgi:transposase